MDLHTVTSFRRPTTRAELFDALDPGERFLAGGTWVFSDPDPEVTGLIDLMSMGWPDVEHTADGGLHIGATCPIDVLSTMTPRADWRAQPLFGQCADALLASVKVRRVATVGGNLGRSFAAASMVALLVTLDAEAVIWCPDGTNRRVDVCTLPTGNGTNSLRPGEVIRSLEIPAGPLRSRTAFAKIALARFGRSGAVVTARLDDDGRFTIVVTAATDAVRRLRYPAVPDVGRLRADLAGLTGYYTDALGAADWRRGVTGELGARVRAELADDVGALECG